MRINSSQLLRPGAFVVLALASASSAQAALVINEVDADTPGTDSLEFIELFNTGPSAVNLGQYSLVLFNGADTVAPANGSYSAFQLNSVSLNPGQFFLIGPAALPGTNQQFAGATDQIQNGADAVALYQAAASTFPNDTAPTTVNLVDALVYGTNDPADNDLLAALNRTVQFNDTDTTSIQRFPNGAGDFQSNVLPPTPGATNAVPEPASLGLLAVGGLLLTRRNRRQIAR